MTQQLLWLQQSRLEGKGLRARAQEVICSYGQLWSGFQEVCYVKDSEAAVAAAVKA